MKRPRTRNHLPRETIDEIRSRSDIVEVISECGIALPRCRARFLKHSVRFTPRKRPPLLCPWKSKFSTVSGAKLVEMLSLSS